MAENDERPLRFCDVCGQLDDHPRHVVQLVGDATEGTPSDEFLAGLTMGDAPVYAVKQLVDGTFTCRHMDCCAANGCPTCQATEAEYGERRGQKLIDHLAEERAKRVEA
jgi:hypothetical protein